MKEAKLLYQGFKLIVDLYNQIKRITKGKK